MKLNKSPENDGLSVEFYPIFWPVIGDLVLASFNEAFKHRETTSLSFYKDTFKEIARNFT